MTASNSSGTGGAFNPYVLTRPDPALMRYYIIMALFSGPFFPIAIIPMIFRYKTLQYRIDESGIAMSWGIFFKREIYLTYRRIQDIHLSRNIVQRWMSLATLSIQTASGSATPEMSIEGILEADALRDFLYTRMRGAHHDEEEAPAAASNGAVASQDDEALHLLREIRDLLRNRDAQKADKS